MSFKGRFSCLNLQNEARTYQGLHLYLSELVSSNQFYSRMTSVFLTSIANDYYLKGVKGYAFWDLEKIVLCEIPPS